jgi:hypothetical protein
VKRMIVVLAIVVVVAAGCVLGCLEAFTSVKPFSRASCAVDRWERSEFGGRERQWDDYQERCVDGLRYYR